MTKLVPIVTPANLAYFCVQLGTTAPYVFPAQVGDAEVLTGFIRTGVKVDLLSLSHSPSLLEAGEIDYTDSIDTNVRLSAVAIGTPDGAVMGIIEIPEVTPTAHAAYAVQGAMRLLALNFESHDFEFEDKKIHLALTGSINLQTGTLQVAARELDDGLTVVGFTLDAERVNSNRRPHHVQV
jgi:hypothetical protein